MTISEMVARWAPSAVRNGDQVESTAAGRRWFAQAAYGDALAVIKEWAAVAEGSDKLDGYEPVLRGVENALARLVEGVFSCDPGAVVR